MNHLSHFQVNETYIVSMLSLFCVCLFIAIKYNHSWSRERHLVCLICSWGLLQLAALVLFALTHSECATLPEFVEKSLYTVLAAISMWGVAIIQIIGIIFPFSVAIRKEHWLKWIGILQCVEVMLVVILAMIPQVSIPIELTYIAPLTSQAAAIGVMLLSSSDMKRGRPAKNTADHLLFLSLFIVAISALVAGLSLSGYYEKLILPQWFLYMTVPAVSYRLPEKEQQDDRRWYRL